MAFAVESVKRLRESDFSLDTRERICLKYDDCILVFFYTENTESKHMAKLWATAAAQVAGPIFAACNVIDERRVAEAFTQLNMDLTHPFHWCGLKELPFILVYQRSWPKAFFNGERTVETFVDYGLTLACQASYVEHEHEAKSMQVENRLVMAKSGKSSPPRTVSTEFTGVDPIRHYDPQIPPVIRGSEEEAAAIREIQTRVSSQPIGSEARPVVPTP